MGRYVTIWFGNKFPSTGENLINSLNDSTVESDGCYDHIDCLFFNWPIQSYLLMGFSVVLSFLDHHTSRFNYPFPSPHKPFPTVSNQAVCRWSGLSFTWMRTCKHFLSGLYHITSIRSAHVAANDDFIFLAFFLLVLLEIELRVGMHSSTELHAQLFPSFLWLIFHY